MTIDEIGPLIKGKELEIAELNGVRERLIDEALREAWRRNVPHNCFITLCQLAGVDSEKYTKGWET